MGGIARLFIAKLSVWVEGWVTQSSGGFLSETPNLQFPGVEGSAFVTWFGGSLDNTLCEKHEREVGKNDTVSFQGMSLRIPADWHRYPDGGCVSRHASVGKLRSTGRLKESQYPQAYNDRPDRPITKWTTHMLQNRTGLFVANNRKCSKLTMTQSQLLWDISLGFKANIYRRFR